VLGLAETSETTGGSRVHYECVADGLLCTMDDLQEEIPKICLARRNKRNHISTIRERHRMYWLFVDTSPVGNVFSFNGMKYVIYRRPSVPSAVSSATEGNRTNMSVRMNPTPCVRASVDSAFENRSVVGVRTHPRSKVRRTSLANADMVIIELMLLKPGPRAREHVAATDSV